LTHKDGRSRPVPDNTPAPAGTRGRGVPRRGPVVHVSRSDAGRCRRL
jgi:hypothetical protein